jgi:hypothetical protein
LADGVAALVSGGMFMYLGFYLGNRLNEGTVEHFKHWFFAGVGVVAVGCLIWFVWRSRRARLAAERATLVARAGLIDVPAAVHDAGASFNIGKAGHAVTEGGLGAQAVAEPVPPRGLVQTTAPGGKV